MDCRAKGYILPHDVVSIHTTCGDWAYVTFINNKLQRSAGWIESKRISSSPFVPVEELAEQAHATQIELQKGSKKSPNERNHDVCKTVSGYASLGVLDRFNIPKDTVLSEENVESIFGKDTSIYGGGDYWHIDLNGDGIPEHLMMTSQGTAHIGVSYVRSENKNSETQELQFSGDDVDASLIRIGTEYFFAAGNGTNLHELWRLSDAGKLQSVCEFSQSDQPTTHIIFGIHNPVCTNVVAGQISLVDFNQRTFEEMKSLDSLNDGNIHQLLAHSVVKLDIDNEGHKKNVTLLSYSRPGGRECDWTTLVVTNESSTNVPKSSLNDLLLGFLGDNSMCWSNMNAFVYLNTTYIDLQIKDGDRSIYQIRDNKVQTVCKFERHFTTN
jgi:hypothetical protein